MAIDLATIFSTCKLVSVKIPKLYDLDYETLEECCYGGEVVHLVFRLQLYIVKAELWPLI